MSGLAAIGFLVLAAVGIALSALYSGLETGLYTLNPVRLTVRAARGEAAAVRLRRMTRHPARTLTVLLIGTNTANYLGTFAVAELLHGRGLGDWTLIAVQAAIMTPVLFVFAETLPKDLFRTYTDRWTYHLSPLISVSRFAFTWTGLLLVVEHAAALASRLAHGQGEDPVSSRQRISQLIREGVGAGLLSVAQASISDRALSMHDRRIGSVMVGWRAVAALPAEADAAEREEFFRARGFTRAPVVDTRGHVVGVLTWIEAILERDATTEALMTRPLTFTPDMHLLDALSSMREQRQPMAIVHEPEADRPIGLVTLKDLVEPLTGELREW